LVNKDNYLALVDEAKCDPNQRSSSSNSGSSEGAQSSNYTTATVNSARASNNDPMRMKVWLDESNEDGSKATIFVNASISEAATDTNPYGVFRLDFCGKGLGGGACMMQGFLDGRAGALSYFQNENRGGGDSNTVALHLTSVGTTSGSGKLSMTEV